jgi:hypothetical protein
MSTVKFSDFPPEIIERIVNFLSVKDALKLYSICKKNNSFGITFQNRCKLKIDNLKLKTINRLKFKELELTFGRLNERTFNTYKKFMKSQGLNIRYLKISNIKNAYIADFLDTIRDKKIDELSLIVDSPTYIDFQDLNVKILNLELLKTTKISLIFAERLSNEKSLDSQNKVLEKSQEVNMKAKMEVRMEVKIEEVTILNRQTGSLLNTRSFGLLSIKQCLRSSTKFVYESFKFSGAKFENLDLTMSKNSRCLITFRSTQDISIENFSVSNAKGTIVKVKDQNIQIKKFFFSNHEQDECNITFISGGSVEIEELFLDILSKNPVIVFHSKETITIKKIFLKTDCVSSNVFFWFSPRSHGGIVKEIQSNKPINITHI